MEDFELQKDVEFLVRTYLQSLRKWGVANAAAVIMDNERGEILSLVGSADFFDPYHSGQVNGATSLRQPGSALKPFTYALALEEGMTPATLILDTEILIPGNGTDYVPRNYDGKYHGPVRLREALACSYNVSAVKVLETLGVEPLLHRLKKLGFESLNEGTDDYGLGLTLGGGEVTLLELTRAYSPLARLDEICFQVTPVREVRISMRIGGVPNWTTFSWKEKSSVVRSNDSNPNSFIASIILFALFELGLTNRSKSPVYRGQP